MKTKISLNSFKFIALALLMISGYTANAQREKLQTAFIFQLTRLIEWCPAGKQGNFVIGVLGDAPATMAEFSALNGRKVAGQTIELQNFASVDNIVNCNILFIPASRSGDIKAAAAKIGKNCTLIVADKSGSAGQGAGISLVYLDDQSKIQYEINKSYMSKYSLNVNDQLFKLAKEVF
jgi:hypothetical protein